MLVDRLKLLSFNFLLVPCPSSIKKIMKRIEFIYFAIIVIKHLLHYQYQIIILGRKMSHLKGCEESFSQDTVGFICFILSTILCRTNACLGHLGVTNNEHSVRHVESL